MKIRFHSESCVPAGDVERNIAHAHRLDLPYPSQVKTKMLAVIGGSPSVKSRVEEIKAFDGDIWIIASAYPWATSQGITGTYFSIDPSPENALEVSGVTKAILGSPVHPDVFKALADQDVSVFDLVENEERLNHGVTTATAVPELAILLGYEQVTFYGCESSFNGTTHAYRHDDHPHWMDIKTNGEEYRTRGDYFMQAEFLATMIRRFPNNFQERSGGLLSAMIADMDYDCVRVSKPLHEVLTRSA